MHIYTYIVACKKEVLFAMSLPFPETFVRRRPSTNTSVHSFEHEAGTLGSRSDLSNRDVRSNVHEENSPLRILSDLERFSPDDLELILTLRDDLTVKNIDDIVRHQFQGQTFLPNVEHPEHDLHATQGRNEMS